MGRQKIFTAEDRKEVLKELMGKEEEKTYEKEREKFYETEIFYDDCPVCGKLAKFENKGARRTIAGKEYIEMECPECHKNAYVFIEVLKTGSAMEGYNFEPIVSIMDFRTANKGHSFAMKK